METISSSLLSSLRRIPFHRHRQQARFDRSMIAFESWWIATKIKSLSFSVNLELYSSLPQPSCACRKVSDTKDRSAQSLGVVQSDMILPTSISPIRSSLELFDGFTTTGTKLREEEKRDFESITSSSRHLFRKVDEWIYILPQGPLRQWIRLTLLGNPRHLSSINKELPPY